MVCARGGGVMSVDGDTGHFRVGGWVNLCEMSSEGDAPQPGAFYRPPGGVAHDNKLTNEKIDNPI